MRRVGTAFLLFFFAVVGACAQSTLLQSGTWTPGHAPMYSNPGSGQPVVQDSGPAGGGGLGLGMKEGLYVARGTGTAPFVAQGTGPYGTNWCDYDAPVTNLTGYHYLCFSPNAQGGGLIAYGPGGTASQLPFNFIINGVKLPISGGGGGASLTQQQLTVTAPNTLSALATAQSGAYMHLSVNGQDLACFGPSSACGVSGENVTWYAASAGYSLSASDNVVASYTF